MERIAAVIPTIRPNRIKEFKEAWGPLFEKHDVFVILVRDGDDLRVRAKPVMGKYTDLIYNLSDCCRNLGFAYVAKYLPEIETIITLDDDTKPIGDPIQDHLDTLERRVPVSWMYIASQFTRGFPYEVRHEAEVVLSHGVWEGIKDYDAPTQLVKGNMDCDFYQGPIYKGVYYPMCGMNLAFKRKLLPYMYFAPMGPKAGLDRFADIWCGIESKKVIDQKGWAVVTGYAKVQHERASNVYKNLQKEALGIELNEGFWKGIEDHPYFKLYAEKRRRWEEFINACAV
jgi:reversibly glycosylated polypeptide/UDP-arabinopyranose mutase